LPESHPSILRVLNELCGREIATRGATPGATRGGTPGATRGATAATPNCDAAIDRLKGGPDSQPDQRAAVYVSQSRLSFARQDLTAARNYAVLGVAAAETAGMPQPLWQAYYQLATVLRARSETALGVFFGKQAIAQIERERSHFVGEDRRLDRGFLRDKVSVYRGVADWLLEQGRIDEGLSVLRLMKTEELTDFGVRVAALGAERNVDLTEEEIALQARYARAVQADVGSGGELARLSILNETSRITPAERERLQGLLAGKSAAENARALRIENLLQEPFKADSGEALERRIDAPALALAARSFGADTAFAVYLLTEHHLRILVTARGVQEEFRIPVDAAQLQLDIGHFLDDIAQRRDATAMSEKLYAVIARHVDAFAAEHRAHRLALWLDGSLRYVPIAALHDGRQYLLDKYVIQLYTPAAESGAPSAPPRPAPSLVRGFGVTRAIAGFAALPAVADELCYVVRGPIEGLDTQSDACAAPSTGRGALQGAGFADSAFTEQRFRELFSGRHDFSVLHIGTHFRLRSGNALRSFLLLGDGTKLTLDAIGGFDFHAIDVVTLSACETGLGGARTDDGREVEGLSALVQRRGAGQVIASLWQVEDVSTAQLMRALYTAFSASHGDAALGLQQAQHALRLTGRNGNSYANPYYWAGFSVSGSHP
jgi:CHAT domain-containing protein